MKINCFLKSVIDLKILLLISNNNYKNLKKIS